MALVKSHIPFAVKIENFPEQSGSLTYNTNSQSPTWKYFDTSQVEIVGGTTSATNAGTYYTKFKPLRKYVFPNGTKKIYTAEWKIKKAAGSVTFSENSGEVKIGFTRTFTVSRLGDGKISVSSSDTNIATVSVSGNTVTITGKSVGNATITVSVAEGTNYLATSKNYSCQSRKTKITVPTVTDTTKTFTGNSQSPTIANAPSTSLVTRTGTVSATAYNADAYSFTYSIKNTNAYEWSDGTTADKTFYWRINKKVFALPEQSGTLTYNGNYQTPTWNIGSSSLISISGDNEKNSGDYTATFSLNDTTNCEWANGTTSDKEVSWTIAKKKLTIPTWDGATLTYGGGMKTANFYNYDSATMLKGDDYAWDAETYKAWFELRDKENYCWSDGSTTDKYVNWTIEKASATIPTLKANLSFTGAEQTPTFNNYDSSIMEISGTESATNVGSYTAYFSLTDSNYKWSDGTTGQKSVKWEIEKVAFNSSAPNFYDFQLYVTKGGTDPYNKGLSESYFDYATAFDSLPAADGKFIGSAYDFNNGAVAFVIKFKMPVSEHKSGKYPSLTWNTPQQVLNNGRKQPYAFTGQWSSSRIAETTTDAYWAVAYAITLARGGSDAEQIYNNDGSSTALKGIIYSMNFSMETVNYGKISFDNAIKYVMGEE